MIPLRDSIPSRTTPVVNYAIIVLCTLAFFWQGASGRQDGRIVEQFGMVPARLSNPGAELKITEQVPVQTRFGVQIETVTRTMAEPVIPAWMTILTCMFLHGGWMHFLGNMWFLYIFGDNVEDRLGHLGYATLYLGTGIAAGLAHYVTERYSPIPTIGASGAIAGVMGAYAYLYPHAKVIAVIPLFVILQTIIVPAPVFLGLWFLLQAFSGVSAIAGGVAGGVAWWAHIGGFVAGAVVAVVLGRSPQGHEAVTERRF
ncbi:rhomboid family intramembrane serine protease [Novipirellula artificiosorum]|uniref:Rhomboid protease GluP n=1 Tax=Novipirellula artificiosorum TaxID=2528016 RepID=A0A5C6DYS9_9BACT|nr:rhomboid family intramembrane serine protease [Novipirellula artificiosorum]TWU42593.1 Rhomboid protease GluP [Novipirellula artificiosorum]